jgi:hypothetical protein
LPEPCARRLQICVRHQRHTRPKGWRRGPECRSHDWCQAQQEQLREYCRNFQHCRPLGTLGYHDAHGGVAGSGKDHEHLWIRQRRCFGKAPQADCTHTHTHTHTHMHTYTHTRTHTHTSSLTYFIAHSLTHPRRLARAVGLHNRRPSTCGACPVSGSAPCAFGRDARQPRSPRSP